VALRLHRRLRFCFLTFPYIRKKDIKITSLDWLSLWHSIVRAHRYHLHCLELRWVAPMGFIKSGSESYMAIQGTGTSTAVPTAPPVASTTDSHVIPATEPVPAGHSHNPTASPKIFALSALLDARKSCAPRVTPPTASVLWPEIFNWSNYSTMWNARLFRLLSF